MELLSIIVPCYNEEAALPYFWSEIIKITDKMKLTRENIEFEFMFVDDGSKDGTLGLLRDYAKQDKRVKYFSFSRNFGKESAMYAGFCKATGNYVVVMDADMQDPPNLLCEMWDILHREEYDCVATRRVDRGGEPPIRSWFAKKFYKLINKISDTEVIDGARDFRMMKKEMIEAIVSINEYNRFSKGIFGWIGFRTYWLAYENVQRISGKTKWNFGQLFRYGIDGIISFSNIPLTISSWFGIGMTGSSFIALIFIVLRRLIFGDPVAGWASTICVIIFIGGVQMLCMGIMGQYLAKMYMETKKRPHFIIAETNDKN